MLCLRLVVLVLNYLLEFGTATAYADFGSPSSAEVTADAYESQGSQVQNSNCVSETFKICKVRKKVFLDFPSFLFAL